MVASRLKEGALLATTFSSSLTILFMSDGIKKPRFSRILYFELEKPHKEKTENKPRLDRWQTTEVP